MPFNRGPGGRQGTSTIVYGAGMSAPARQAGAFLAAQGSAVSYSTAVVGFERGGGPAIVFLTVEEAARTPWVADLLKPGSKSGTFLALEGGRLEALDASGKPSAGGAPLPAAIVSTGSGIGDSSPVWLALGEGSAGAAQLGRLVVQRGGLDDRFGVAVEAGGRVLPLPR